MDSISLEELIMAVRRQSQGFSRGTSAYRGVTHHPSGQPPPLSHPPPLEVPSCPLALVTYYLTPFPATSFCGSPPVLLCCSSAAGQDA